MRKFMKELCICGEETPVEMFETSHGKNMVRATYSGVWGGPQDLPEMPPEYALDVAEDGSFTITAQELVPVNVAMDNWAMENKMDETLNRMEEALNLEKESISSSSWWVGSATNEFDHLMPAADQAFIKACERETGVKE